MPVRFLCYLLAKWHVTGCHGSHASMWIYCCGGFEGICWLLWSSWFHLHLSEVLLTFWWVESPNKLCLSELLICVTCYILHRTSHLDGFANKINHVSCSFNINVVIMLHLQVLFLNIQCELVWLCVFARVCVFIQLAKSSLQEILSIEPFRIQQQSLWAIEMLPWLSSHTQFSLRRYSIWLNMLPQQLCWLMHACCRNTII